jgi:PhnB protein
LRRGRPAIALVASKLPLPTVSNIKEQAMPKGKPEGNLAPHLVCAGASDAIEFYKKAFAAEEMLVLAGDDSKIMHAALSINGSMVMLVDENPNYGLLSPKALNGTPVFIHLNVPDVDRFFERAVAAGAKPVMPVADMFWGDRYGVVEDPWGHRWSIATHLRDMTVDELKAAAKSAMGSC